ncbi:MAG: GNAT family N-acetyltransferase [Verrucomicrobiota bacterium]
MAVIEIADLNSERDGRAVLELLNEYAVDIAGGGEPLSAHTREHLIGELRKRLGCRVVLAFEDDEPAGLAICFEAFSTFKCQPILNIHDFTVAPRFRGRGIAKAMLSRIEELALEQDCGKLTLEVLEGNEVARRLYAGVGFKGYELDPKMGHALFLEKVLAE